VKYKEQIKLWQSKFRILKDWDIQYSDDNDWTGGCNFGTNKAEIFPWGQGEVPNDYIFHEIIHICLGAIRNNNTIKEKREAEELFVQDLCIIMGDKCGAGTLKT